MILVSYIRYFTYLLLKERFDILLGRLILVAHLQKCIFSYKINKWDSIFKDTFWDSGTLSYLVLGGGGGGVE